MQTADLLSSQTGQILHFQRLSTEDGPGIRTTIFFKGCSLKCAWCHNPESIQPHSELQWLNNRCIACHSCLEVCPSDALNATQSGIEINRQRCTACEICAKHCPTNALEILGQSITIENTLHELRKDKPYYTASGGGVTASGGEPAIQAQFVARIFESLRSEDISTALDTCGACRLDQLQVILPWSDLILFDIKLIDPVLHKHFTGASNQHILANLAFIANYMDDHPNTTRLWIRTPLIPGATANPENIQAIGQYLGKNLGSKVERWELCAFNNLCKDKYSRLGLDWPYAATPLLSSNEISELEHCAKLYMADPARVSATGNARLQTND